MSETCRLFLITPPLADAARFAPMLEVAVNAADVACVLLRTAGRDEGEAKTIIRTLGPLVRDSGAALLVEGDPRFAARVDADGLHVTGTEAALDEAIASLQPQRIVGAGGLTTRDAAMRAGEAGVDYVMFGGPGGDSDPGLVEERATWWAEIFNVPCVACARHPDEAEVLARTGVEFVALGDGLWDEPAHIAMTIRAIAAAISAPAKEIAR